MNRIKLVDRPGTPCPFQSLDVVRDIEQFEGPLLTELRNEAGDSFVEKYCDEDDDVMRMMRVKTSPQLIAKYLSGEIPMYEMLASPVDGVVTIVDYFRDGRSEASTTQVMFVPDAYMPQESAMYDPSLAPDAD